MGSDLDDQVVGERDNSDENGDCSPQTYATEEDRMAAFLEFQAQQNKVLARQHADDDEHALKYQKMLALEIEVDLKVNDAIRHAETEIQEAKVEI